MIYRTVKFGLLIVFLVSISVTTALSQTHVALIIGNSKYKNVPALTNPTNDAEDISVALSEMGYDVSVQIDTDYETMRSALNAFSEKAFQAEVAIVYFAGHGIEIDKTNYLIPTDATLRNDNQVALQAIPLDLVINAVGAASKLRVVLLDSCRNNPFLSNMRSAGTANRATQSRGLARVEPTGGTLVSFAARAGTTASDGRGRNSPYTEALLNHIRNPLLDVGRLFRKVRDDVLSQTGRKQEPFLYGSLPGTDVFLAPGRAPSPEQPQADTNASPPKKPANDEARTAWDAIKDSTRVEIFRTFIAHYGSSIYAKFAQARIKTLEDANPQPGPTPPAPPLPDQNQPQRQINWYLARYKNLDLFGGDIHRKGRRASSFRECASRCGNNLGCRAFTYNQVARRCFLKSGFEFAQVYSGAASGLFFRGQHESNAPSFNANWEVFGKSDLHGIDLGPTRARTFPHCMSDCARTRACTGFSFVHFARRKRCWLKAGALSGPISNRNARKGVTSARRIQARIEPFRIQRSSLRR